VVSTLVHEWALAESVALYLEANNLRKIKSLKISLGLLQSVDKEIFEFSLLELLKEKGITVETLQIIEEGAKLVCNTCGFAWNISSDEFDEFIRESIHFVPESISAFTKCPRCGSRDFKIAEGRGLNIVEVIPA